MSYAKLFDCRRSNSAVVADAKQEGRAQIPSARQCAMLAWRAVEQALAQTDGEATISTEADTN